MNNNNVNRIVVPPMTKETFWVEIHGTKPLYVHRLPYRAKGEKVPKYTDQEAFKNSIYLIDEKETDGRERHGFRASGIKKACIEGCGYLPTVSKVKCRGLFFIEAPFKNGLVQILDPDDIEHSPEPVMDRYMARRPSGTAIPGIRARYDEWAMIFQVVYVQSHTNLEEVLDILQVAGSTIGIGPQRPEKSGDNSQGTWEVTQAYPRKELRINA